MAALAVALAVFASLLLLGPEEPAAPQLGTAVAGYGELPLSFQPNRGQSDPAVRYLATGPGFGLFLTRDGALLRLGGGRSGSAAKASPASGSALSIGFVGAAAQPRISGIDRRPGTANYLRPGGSAREVGLPTFAGVRYADLWPGIGARFYGNRDHLEYDFDLAPGASASEIGLRFTGQRRLTIAPDGALLLGLGRHTVRQPPPRATQLLGGSARPIPSHYVLRGDDRVGIAVGPYNHARPLRIDPEIIYSTYLGKGVEAPAYSIAVDRSGSAYITGQTTSPAYPVTKGALTPKQPRGAQVTAFVTKLSPDGRRVVYSTYLGTSAGTVGNAIAVDRTGAAFVGGFTYPGGMPTTAGVVQPVAVGESLNGFVAKLAPNGRRLIYSTYLAGSGEGGGQVDAIAVDAAGNAYVAGDTDSNDFPTTPGAAQGPDPSKAPGGGLKPTVFVSKLNPTASQLLYSTLLGGGNWDTPGGIAVDAAGNAYVAGDTASRDFPTTPGAAQPENRAEAKYEFKNAFVTKLDPSGQHFLYSTYLGGTLSDEAKAIAVEPSGRAYVTGDAGSDDFPTTAGVLQRKPKGFDTAFVSIFSPDGALLRSTLVGKETNGRGIALDQQGRVFVVGFRGAPDIKGVNQGYRGFLAELSPSLTKLLTWRKLGGARARAAAVAVDRRGDVYAAGGSSPGLEEKDPVPQGRPPSRADYPSAFVTKLRP